MYHVLDELKVMNELDVEDDEEDGGDTDQICVSRKCSILNMMFEALMNVAASNGSSGGTNNCNANLGSSSNSLDKSG